MKKFFSKYWKSLIAVVMAVVAIPLFMKASEKRKELDQQKQNLNNTLASVQAGINSNMAYADVQEQIDSELERLDASRRRLYDRFSAPLLEEDQIRYIMYLEEVFENELSFSFTQAAPVVDLSDGNQIEGMTYTLSFQTTYEGFKDLVDYLAADDHIASVHVVTLNYQKEQDVAVGSITLTLYTATANPYEPFQPAEHETGKDTIFE